MNYQTKALSYDNRARIFWTLTSLSIIFIAAYIFCINLAVHNTVARQYLEGEVSTLAAKQSSLEFAYIELKNQVSLDVALAYGFREVSKPTYISRTGVHSLVVNR